MALEAVVFPQDPLFSSSSYPTTKADYFHSSFLGAGGPSWTHHHDHQEKLLIGIINNNNIFEHQSNLHHHHATTTTTNNNSDSCNNNSPASNDQWDHHSHYSSTSSPDCAATTTVDQPSFPATTTTGRRKRRRTKTTKNKEEIENQRMTHIAVERNRRKQMNDYLAVLRSLMPPSYVQRGDQASIIGGAINFVKELEQLLQSMEAQKKPNHGGAAAMHSSGPSSSSSPFAEFFTFPQYTTRAHHNQQQQGNNTTTMAAAVADIEVTMVDNHANLKILSKKRNGQLIKMVVGLQSLRLTILHLNVTTLHDLVLYSVSVKVEDECQLNTVDEIAAAVNQLLSALQQEPSSSFNSIN
ncbi:hypothetical protein PIB30_029677 [Stylosanthes scabra]|uniref:BHLH domain-containing protein n=1 Tax=Stylosanthes scabra TaxID=79078 RepID=A0ABU6UAJ6_9FABA|nr:hypothetical protein [Stylosanthes scabra]